MGMRAFAPMVTACPGCGRTTSSFFQELAQSIQIHLRTQMPLWRDQFEGVESMTVAVMGCVVNGPGEAREANLAIIGGKKTGLIMKNGEIIKKVDEKNLLKEFIKEVKKF